MDAETALWLNSQALEYGLNADDDDVSEQIRRETRCTS